MSSEQFERVGEIYHAAMELAPEARPEFLTEACAGDDELRREVESLLRAREQADGFIAGKVADVAAEMAAQQKNPSLVGHSISHYQVLSLLGAGGMGEVYLAQDTRLGRKVALKLLPGAFTRDQERLRRFEREARLVSVLNHPNILTIYEVGSADDTNFIATEFIDGQTLRERLRLGRLDLSESLDLARQIASALSAAHEADIVHRDIKPENVMTRRDSGVKVLDFGLAKLLRDEGGGMKDEFKTNPHPSSLIPHPSTMPGMVMGTPQYMSPEQARGQQADARSDIFSLGVVLYEMLTGCPPFTGVNAIEVMGAILNRDPAPLKQHLTAVPDELQRIVSKALRKNRDERYQTTSDLLNDLNDIKEELAFTAKLERSSPGERDVAVPVPADATVAADTVWVARSTSSAEYILTEIKRHRAAIILVVLLSAAGGLAFAWYRFIRLPQTATTGLAARVVPFTTFPGFELSPSFSPDGNQVAFAWNGEKGDNFDIYVKLIDVGTPLRLTTSPAKDEMPAFSPDGRHIAFLRTLPNSNTVYLVPSLGGPERKLADLFPGSVWPGASYAPDGKSLAVSDKGSAEEPFALHLISVETGERRKLTSPPAGWIGDGSPAFSPDGKWMAFIRSSGSAVADLYIMPAAGGEVKRLTFDKTFIGIGDGRGVGSLAWTADGREIVFASARGGSIPHLWRVAASGGEPVRVEGVGPLAFSPVVSARGGRLAYTQFFYDLNIWRLPLGENRRVGTPTNVISSTLHDESPSYSPDGRKIAFTSTRSGSYEIWVCEADGANPVQLTNLGGPVTGTTRWSPDGRWIAFDSRVEGNPDIFVINPEGGRPRRLTTEASEDSVPSWSRDARFIYFSSLRSGSLQIWKMPAEGGEARQLTKQGGFEGYESADGKYFYYMKGGDTAVSGIWRVPAEGGEETLVFDQHRAGIWRSWAVTEQGIYYVTGETPARTVIEYYSFAAREIRVVATPEKEVLTRSLGLVVSPDGKWLLYTQADQRGMDIRLVEDFR